MQCDASSAAPAVLPASATPAAAAATAAAATPAPFTPAFSIGELQRGGAQLNALCHDLASINACAYCMMRFANVKQEKAFQQTKQVTRSEARELARGGARRTLRSDALALFCSFVRSLVCFCGSGSNPTRVSNSAGRCAGPTPAARCAWTC